MHKFFLKRKFLLFGFSFFLALGVLFSVATKVFALSSVALLTGGVAAYTDTSFSPTVTFSGLSGDLAEIYITSGSSSGNVGIYSGKVTLDAAYAGGAPWTPTITFGAAFLPYTGSNLRLHGFVFDSGHADTGYLSQAIVFSPDVWKMIYSNIYYMLIASNVDNNFNLVTGGNVTSFTNLYFAKLSGAAELGRITFTTPLDLTDSDVQTLLSNLGSGDVMNMNEGSIKFSPGAVAAMKTGATVTMNFGGGNDFISGVNDPSYFLVFSDTGQLLDSSTVMSSITSDYAGDSGYITFAASHFTDFILEPNVLSLTISSDNANPSYANIGDTITVDLVLDTISNSVDMILSAGASTGAMSVTGAGKARSGTYTITTGSQGLVTFSSVVNFPTRAVSRSLSETDITDSSSVTFDTITPVGTIIYSTTGWTNADVLASITGTNLTGFNETGYTFTGNGSFEFTFTDLAGNTGSTTALVANIDKVAPSIVITTANGTQFTGSTLTITGTGNDVDTALASVTVNGSGATGTTGWSVTLAGLTAGANNFTVTGTDTAGNTVYATGSVTRIAYSSNISALINSGTSATIAFTTDIAATGNLLYGTSALLTSVASTSSTSHSFTLSTLIVGSTYNYRVWGLNNGFTGTLSATGTFIPTSAVLVTTGGDYTGDALIVGYTTTGFASATQGDMRVYTSGSLTDGIGVDLNGLNIDVTGGSWDGIVSPPAEVADPTLGIGGLPAVSTNNGSTTTNRVILFTVEAGANSGISLLSTPNFGIWITVSGGNVGDVLKVYRSVDGTTWAANSPDPTCTLDSNKLCSFFTDHLSYFTVVQESSSNNPSGGGGGGAVQKDYCPSGDNSASFYDNKCDAAITTGDNAGENVGSIDYSTFSDELNNAYLYAYSIGITTMTTIQGANMEGELIRSHMAKMMVNYAVKVLGLQPDTTKTCSFTDTMDQSTELKGYITLACQLGLMGVGMESFEPNTVVSRAQFGTILSRALYGNQYEGSTPYYLGHLTALKTASIMNNITDPENMKEIRGYVMLMMMRAKK